MAFGMFSPVRFFNLLFLQCFLFGAVYGPIRQIYWRCL